MGLRGVRLFNRQKVLLRSIFFLNRKGIQRSRRAIIKTQFLLKKEYRMGELVKFYSFFPYKQGPFSHLCFHDLRQLKGLGLIDESETILTDKGHVTIDEIGVDYDFRIKNLLNRFSTESEITGYVYEKYPEYTVKSELIKEKPVKHQEPGFFTIGYEGKNIDSFLNVLIGQNIDLIVDVRKNPFSMNFAFTKGSLKKYLESADIDYINVPELGIESKDRKELKTKSDYEELFLKYRNEISAKKQYIDKIIEMGKIKRLALLCFEADADFCHRREIANSIRNLGPKVKDI